MENNRPNAIKLSIIIPAYNEQENIARALDSLLAQQYEGTEIIVINDGSTDATGSVCAEYVRTHGVVYKEQENKGCASAKNAGLEIARGKYIAFLDADDVILPGSLKKRADVLDRQPETQVVFSNFRVIDSHGTPPYDWVDEQGLALLKSTAVRNAPPVYILGDGYLKAALSRPNLFPSTLTIMARHEVFDEIGFFNPTLRAGEDLDMWLRMHKYFTFAFIDNSLCIYNWDLGRPIEDTITRLACRLRLFSDFKSRCPKHCISDLNLIIGKAHMDIGLLLAQNKQTGKGLGHVMKALCYPFIYKRIFRSVPPLIFKRDPGLFIQDTQRIVSYAQKILGKK